jgi:predicted DNA-binding WGR domain protein
MPVASRFRAVANTGCEGFGAGVNAWRERRASKGCLARAPPFLHGLRAGRARGAGGPRPWRGRAAPVADARAVANGVKFGREPGAHPAARRRFQGLRRFAHSGVISMNAVTLYRIDPARNMRRFYALDVQPDLFGCVLLMKQCGRIGTAGKDHRRAFRDGRPRGRCFIGAAQRAARPYVPAINPPDVTNPDTCTATRGASRPPRCEEFTMKDQRLQIADVVGHIDDATLGNLNVPEFQRKYVWRPSKVADLVDSLWRGYPIGTLLLWESGYEQPRTALGTQGRKLWIVDGQQRVTSLALLFGKKPYWWSDAAHWNKLYERYDVLANIAKSNDTMEFSLVNPIRRKSNEWVSVRRILNSKNLSELAMDVAKKLGDEGRFAEIHEKLQSIKKIESVPLYEIIVDHELEDVAEIFARLNTAGTKIRESDIIIALIAAKQQGWIRQKFDPFLKDLAQKGFELDPGVVVRTFAIISKGNARLRDIPQESWEPSNDFDENWVKTKESISSVIKNLMKHGVLSSDLLPSLNALIPIFVLRAHYAKDFDFKKALRWFLIATRDGRYSGSAVTVLDSDTKLVKAQNSFAAAIAELTKQISAPSDFTADDFQEEHTDKFLRLILYLTIFASGAKELDKSGRARRI